MGILRFILALNILLLHLPHLGNVPVIGAIQAVSIFFMISGFYMAFILNEKYIKKAGSYKLFITNRFLRIFPTYWVVLLALIILSTIKLHFHIGTGDDAITHFTSFYAHASSGEYFFAMLNFWLRNLTLLITTDYFWNISKYPGFLLVQQAWTLQLELLFYLVAPFIARLKFSKLLLFTVLLLCFNYFVFSFHLLSEELLISNFLNCFIFFLLGIFSYKLFTILKNIELKRNFLIKLILFAFAFIYLFSFTGIFYYLVIAGVLPFFFLFSRTIKIDAWIGEFSYPVYLTHFLFIKFINNFPSLYKQPVLSIFVIIALTLTVSWLIIKYIDVPINQYRQRRITLLKQVGKISRNKPLTH